MLKQQIDAEIKTGQSKEVDEWLMGSGESAETAVTHNFKDSVMFKIVEQKSKAPLPNPSNKEDKDDWMYKTFSKDKVAKKEELKSEDKPDAFSGIDSFMMSKRIEHHCKQTSGMNSVSNF